MKLPEEIKNQIIEVLKPLDPEKVILFGSYAYGEPNPDSDIDLYIVTKDDFMPKNYTEDMEIYLKYANAMQSILQQYPTDLITHTKPMYKKFIELNSSFTNKILQKGVNIL